MQQHQRLGWSAIFSKHNIMKSSSSNICSSIKDDLAQNFYMQSSNKSTTVDYNTKIIYFGLKNITVDSLISVSPRRVKNVLLTST